MLVLLVLFSASFSAFAGASIWSSTNIQYLYGTNYELGDDTRSIITLEHVNGWKYGDNFFFVDITNPDRQGDLTTTEFYGEISPRFSLSALTGKDLKMGVVKDVLVTTTLEVGQGFHNYLYGLAVDLDLPKLKVFQVNWYVRNEITANTDLGQQVTLVWLLPFDVGSTSWVFEGFLDYAYGVDPSKDNIITAPRLLLDVGKFFDAPGTLQAGVEYQIWRNKFGIDGVDEDVAQAMVKWIW
jgi:nucleoside-specific outer membrane channel protein Tsx